MMRSVLDIFCTPKFRIKLRNFEGAEVEVEALVDTGYSSTLNIPPHLAATLNLAASGPGIAHLADGSRQSFEYFDVQIEWDGHFIDVVASAMGSVPLVGIRLLRGHQLRIDVEPFGKLEIESLPVSPRP